MVCARLDADDGNQFFDGGGAFVEGGFFFRGELDFDDLLEAFRAQLAGDADEQAVDAVLAFEVGGAGENLLFVFQDGLSVTAAEGA